MQKAKTKKKTKSKMATQIYALLLQTQHYGTYTVRVLGFHELGRDRSSLRTVVVEAQAVDKKQQDENVAAWSNLRSKI